MLRVRALWDIQLEMLGSKLDVKAQNSRSLNSVWVIGIRWLKPQAWIKTPGDNADSFLSTCTAILSASAFCQSALPSPSLTSAETSDVLRALLFVLGWFPLELPIKAILNLFFFFAILNLDLVCSQTSVLLLLAYTWQRKWSLSNTIFSSVPSSNSYPPSSYFKGN